MIGEVTGNIHSKWEGRYLLVRNENDFGDRLIVEWSNNVIEVDVVFKNVEFSLSR